MTASFVKTHQPCPCGKSSDAYAVREDGSGRCFGQCGGRNFFAKPFKDHALECTERPYASRNVKPEYGARLRFAELVDAQGYVQFYKFYYPNGVVKIRRVHDKDQQQVLTNDLRPLKEAGLKQPALGGLGLYDVGSSKTCVLVEGEPDAAAAYHMLNDGMANETPVYWLPGASISNSVDARRTLNDELSRYDRVVVASENDDAARKSKEVLAQLPGLRGKLREVTLNRFHDASDYLVNGAVKEFKRAVAAPSHFTPEYIANGAEKFAAIWEKKETRNIIPTAFPNLNAFIKGICRGEVLTIAGQTGIGKTELLRSLLWSVLSDEKNEAGVSASFFEEPDPRTLAALANYHQGRDLRFRRDNGEDIPLEEIAPTLEVIGDKLFLTDFYKARDDMSVQSFMDKVNYLHSVCGVRYFFFDPINQLRPDSKEESLVQFLEGIAMEMGRFCSSNDSACVWTAHVNADGDTKNSKGIGQQTSQRINVERDKNNPDPEVANTLWCLVDKNRPFSVTGPAGGVKFDNELFILSGEVVEGQPEKKTEETKKNFIPF